MKARSVLVVLWGWLWVQPVMAGQLQFSKSIGTGPLARQDLVVLTLDDEIHAGTRPAFEDIRIYDQDGSTVPFLLERATSVSHYREEARFNGTIESLNQLPDNRMELIVRPPVMDTDIVAIEICNQLHDFEKTLTIHGGNGTTWTLLAEACPIFDYTRFADVRSLRVRVAAHGRFARYRLTFSDVTDMAASAYVQVTRTHSSRDAEPDSEQVQSLLSRRDFRVDRVVFVGLRDRHEADCPITEERSLEIRDTKTNDNGRTTEVIVAADNRPLLAVKILCAEENYGRQVRVETGIRGPGGTQWRSLTRGHIENISFRNLQRINDRISFGETRCDLLKLVFENGDSPPLNVTGVTGVLASYRIWFLGEAGREYQLRFGGRYVDKPSFDTGVLQTLKKEKRDSALPLSLGPKQNAEDFHPANFFRRLAESRVTLALAAIIALAIVTLAVFRALRTIDLTTGEDDSDRNAG